MLPRLFCHATLSLALASAVGCAATRDGESLTETPATDLARPQWVVTPPHATSALERYIPRGRYGLQSTAPRPEQVDPLQQVIEIRITPTLTSSVQEALDYLLQRSGYALCADTPAVHTLFSRPLPSMHYQMGPISLRDALETLAGPAWQLQVDPLLRVVCFSPRLPTVNLIPVAQAEVAP